MLRIVATPKSRAELNAAANPQNTNQPEAIPWVYYDTQAIATASAGPISFFANVNADRTLSNMEQQGTIPDPYYFEIEAINLDYLAGPTIAAGQLNIVDLGAFLYTARATFVFTFAGKEYLRLPCTYLHCSGGPLGITSTVVAAESPSFALNSAPDGGFYVGKKIIIPPKQSFQVQIVFGAAIVLAATRSFRVGLAGVLHRRVL